MKKRFFVFPMLLVVGGLVGCGSDSNTASNPSDTELSESQAQAVAGVITDSLGTAFEESSRLSARTQSNVNASFEGSNTCGSSGSYSVSGTKNFTASGSQIDGDYSQTQSFSDCAVETGSSGIITLNGNVTSNVDVSIDFEGGTGTMSLTSEGSVDVSGDDVTNGTCGVNLSMSATLSGSMLAVTYNGSVCDRSLSYTANISINE